MTAIQGSLLDGFGDAPAVGDLRAGTSRITLTTGAWIDVHPGWVGGSSDVFEALRRDVPWAAERRKMYDRVVDVPRLTHHFRAGAALPHPVVDDALGVLSAHYAAELGEPFVSVGLCYYRDGNDSVAWHGDTLGRGATEDTMVAIVSLGAARTLSLRPRGGGRSRRVVMDSGDLVVMGGSCQRTWEHAVLKTSHPVGARISVQFRTAGVR